MVERRFPGLLAWAWPWAMYAWCGWGVLWFVAGGMRAMEPIFLLVTAPLATLILVWWFALVCSRVCKVGVLGVLQGTGMFAPLAALPGAIGAVAFLVWPFVADSKLTSAVHGSLVSLPGAGSALVTLGLLPRPIAPIGVLCAVAVGAWFLWSIGQRAGLDPFKRGVSLGVFWIGSWFFFLLPSLLSWSGLGPDATVMRAGLPALERGLLSIVHDGFWWPRVYERFFSTAGETSSSIASVWAAGLFLLATAGVVLWLRRSRLSFSVWWQALRPRRFLLDAVACVFGGVLVLRGELAFSGFTVLPALLVMVCIFVFGSLASRLSADLVETLSDNQGTQNPIATGEFPVGLAREMVPLFLVISSVGAWLLGWPLFFLHILRFFGGKASVSTGSALSPTLTRLSSVAWSGLGAGLAAVMGGLWASAAAVPTQPLLFSAFGIAVIFGLVEWSQARRPVSTGG